MNPQIFGISGSPIANSNTDRAGQAVLAASGLPSEFIKLSKINVKPCRACLGCTKDNVCKVQDDFPALAQKVRQAQAIVVGGYSPYGGVDASTKAFLERLYSLRHCKGLNRGKLAVAVATGNGRGLPGVAEACQQICHALTREGMEVLGQVKVQGNPECMVCGFGETCPMSALPRVFGSNPKVTPEMFARVEDQAEAWNLARDLGQEIARRLRASPRALSAD